jgi:hydrogenase maturation protease
MGDEGIGVRVVQELAARAEEWPGVEFADLGTGGMALLHALSGRTRAVLVDCARMGDAPGTMRRFEPEQVRSAAGPPSLHEPDLLGVLAVGRRVGQCPERVVIFGIEPARIGPVQGLSQELERRLGAYAGRVAAELRAP